MKPTYVVLAIGLLVAAFAAPAAAGPAEKMLPEDTVFVLSVDNFTDSWNRLKAHPLYALYNEPDFQKFLEKPLAKMKEMSETSAVQPGDFLELITGQGCFAVTGVREVAPGTNWVGVVVLLDVGENEAKFMEKLKVAEPEAFKTETHRRVEEEFQGVTIVTYLPREGEAVVEGAGTDTGPDCWFLSKGIFALSADPEVLKSLIVRRADPEAKGLGSNEEYKAVTARLGGPGDLLFYVNAVSAWKLIELGMEEGQSEMAMKIMEQIGMREPSSMGANVALTAGGMDQKIYIRSPKPRTGVMKLFDAENSAMMPPRFVPPDVTSAVTVGVDFQGLWQEARRIMDEIQPGMTEQMDQQLAGMKEQIGIDLQADFIGSLGKSVTVYQFEPKPADPDSPVPMPQQRAVFAIEVTNTEKIQQCVDIVAMMAAQFVGMPETEDYMGVQVKTFNTGFTEVAIAVAADHLIVSASKDDLKQLILSLGKEEVKALVDSEPFRKAMSGLPRMRNMITYSDSRRSVDTLIQQINMAAMLQPEIAEWMDVSLLPGELMKKYLDVGGGVMVNEEDGIFLITRSYMNHPKAAAETPEKPAPETPETPK